MDLIRLATLAALVMVAVACGGTSSPVPAQSSSPPEKTSLKVGVGGQSQIIYLPLTLGDQLGYFKDEGITVEITDLKGGADALKAVIGGSVDFVCGFYEHTIRTQAQGKYLEMVALFDNYPGLVLLVNRKHPDAKTIKDLASLKIGVTSLGSSTDEMVRYLFKQSGLDPAAAKTVAVGSGGPAIAALKADQIQALVTVEPGVTTLEQTGDGRVLYDTRTQQGTRDVFGGSWPAGGFYLLTDFAKQYPRTVQALARAAVRTLKYISTHSADDIASHLPAPIFFPDGNKDFFVKVLKASLAMFSPDGKVPADGPDTVFKTLKVADPTTDWSTIDLKKTYDNSYVTRVKV
ncbi:MAG: ABC transporter substrate-binding protein [Chloroflexota bacterium]